MVDFNISKSETHRSFNIIKFDWQPTTFTRLDYPAHYLLILEHENSLYTAWHEIAKLAYFRARLKVLITYHSDDNLEKDKRDQEYQMLEKSLKSILQKNQATSLKIAQRSI